jgi:Fe-S-cluster containining protein
MSDPGRAAIDAGDREFLDDVDATLADAGDRAGAQLDYSLGCPTCCLGPFPINALDTRRLRRGLALLAVQAPERAEAVLARAEEARRRLAAGFPGDPESGRLAVEVGSEADPFYKGHSEVPCPVLDPASHRCELYAFRPLTCRTFGLPLRLGEDDLPPCAACFTGSPAEAEACRAVVDAGDAEGRLLEALHAAGESGETLVAFALRKP